MKRIYSAHLGISTGDIITALRKTHKGGPYEVWSVGQPESTARYVGKIVQLPWPVVGLTMIDPGTTPTIDADFYYINEVRREGDLYYSVHDQVLVDKRTVSAQMSLFSADTDGRDQHDWQPGVNYDCLDGELWHCPSCHKDYNGLTVPTVASMVPGDPRGRRPLCPLCGGWPEELFIVRADNIAGSFGVQNHSRMVEQYRVHCPERIAYLLPTDTKTKIRPEFSLADYR